MPQIIALTGLARAGKSTVTDELARIAGFRVVGFADTLKSMAIAIDPIVTPDGQGMKDLVEQVGWEIAKDRYPAVRRFLQRLGNEGVRTHLDENTWVEAWKAKVLSCDQPVAVPDCRFLNEALAIRQLGGTVWRITRPNVKASSDMHPSEVEMAKIQVDETLVNVDSVEHLLALVRSAYGRIRPIQVDVDAYSAAL